jgi:simple sugar transport system permease protein
MNAQDAAIRYGFIVLMVGLVAIFGAAARGFLTVPSAIFILQSVAITGILALGVTCTLVVGGFDLSIGAVATSALMLSAYVMVVWEAGALAAVALCLLMGAGVGLINGLLIVRMKVPDLLATLGMMFVLLGIQRIPTEGNSIATGMALPDGTTATGTFSPAFLALGRLRIGDVLPLSVVFLLAIAVLVWGFLELTRHGRLMYAIGSNAQAAALAGRAWSATRSRPT